MKLDEILSPQMTLLAVTAADKTRLLTDLSARAAEALNYDSAIIAREILKREELGSTGLGNGIAVPHARLPNLEKPFGLLARLKRPIEFDAIDGLPVDIVFLLLQPAAASSDLNALAAVARALRDAARRERMRAAATSTELYRVVTT